MSAQDSSSLAAEPGSRLRAGIGSLGDIARVYGRHLPHRPAIEFEGRRITYAEFDVRTNQVAQALAASAVGPGDRIAYLGKNCDAYLELLIHSRR